MSADGKKTRFPKNKVRRPPPRWRKYLVQAELELPPPDPSGPEGPGTVEAEGDTPEPAWWQLRPVVLGLAVACAALACVTVVTLWHGARDRAAAAEASARARTLTLRAVNSERTLRIAPNPRSWSARADATIAWPDPPQLLELHLPVGYASFTTFALVVDKVDHGRVMVVERLAPDSNRELRLSLNSSAFGPGEYRLRVQGYTWRGERVDAGWVRLRVEER